MAVTVNLKPKVDLPVWEWCRPLPAATTAISCTCHSSDKRYIYYIVSNSFYRYDTITDSWAQLSAPSITISTLVEMVYSDSFGYYNRAISSGTGLNTINLAVPTQDLVGKKIKILKGKGAGQERVITGVSDPIVAERGIASAANATNITDIGTGVNAKQWLFNQWRDYNARVTYGTGAGQNVRKIISNIGSVLTIANSNIAFWNRWAEPQTGNTAPGTSCFYQIETNLITVDKNWDTIPDSTSECVIYTDCIWLISSTGSSPFCNVLCYDVAADIWYNKTIGAGGQLTYYTTALGTDICLEDPVDVQVPLLSGTVTSSTSASFTDTLLSLSAYQYNNMEVRLLSGTGVGQTRNIHANNSNTFYVARSWNTNPDTSTLYGIYPDTNKIFITGSGLSLIQQYDDESGCFISGTKYDQGVARTITASVSGGEEYSTATSNFLVRTTGGITVLNSTPTAAGTGYVAGQILTITTGGTGGTARILSVNTSGGVTAVALETPGSGYTTGTGKATTVNPAGGTGCTLDITSIGDIATCTAFLYFPFQLGEFVTVKGAAQAAYNGTFKILGLGGSGGNVTSFQYEVTGTPTTPGTSTLSHSTTLLVDVSKNWVPNEHVGKLVQVRLASGFRRITANTANTLSFAAFGSAPANNSNYVIFANKCLGNEQSEGAKLGGGTYGVATSGTTTSLTDSTKNWPVNYWSNTFPSGASNTGRKLRFIQGTGAGTEVTITSNSSNTLNFATQTFTPDSTSVYEIMDMYGMVTAGTTTSMTDTTQNWGTNALVGKRVRFLTGTSTGNEYAITANTQTSLTFATGTAPDTTTAYAILAPNTRSTGINMFNITRSTNSSLNSRYIYMIRGGGTNEIARYDIYTQNFEYITYFPNFETFTTGSMYAYDGEDRVYMQKDATGRIYYYDITKNIIVNSSTIPYGMGTALIGNRAEISKSDDGLKYLYIARHSAQEWWRCLVYW